MGTWGAGNFDNDSAGDWLVETVFDPIVATINECLHDHDEANGPFIMAAVETLAVVCEHLPVMPPEPTVVEKWRDTFLKSWEGYMEDLQPEPGRKEARKRVIEATFDRLLRIANAANRS